MSALAHLRCVAPSGGFQPSGAGHGSHSDAIDSVLVNIDDPMDNTCRPRSPGVPYIAIAELPPFPGKPKQDQPECGKDRA
jgi:hypothetical protein